MLYYIGYYNCDQIRDEDMIVSPATENKMSYIISTLCDVIDERFEVISPAQTRLYRLVRGKRQPIHERVILKTFPTFNSKIKVFRVLGHILTRLSFLVYLLMKVKPEDHVLVYHSLAYMNSIQLLRKMKKCKLTIEVEELYGDVLEDACLKEKELRYLQIADAYLFVSDLLRNDVNTEKRSIISHGTYRALPEYGFRFADNKIHVVYAGIFSKAKGVYTAVSAAEYLDDRYVLEILGDGTEDEKTDLLEHIHEVSQKTDCKIRFVGFKSGEDFNSYIQACHIGLSTQQADAKFNATSFPSKVLMYMSNGLKVVSVRIPAIETSCVGEYIDYYDQQEAKEVARVIRSVSLDNVYDSRAVLDTLHANFADQLKKLLFG